MADNEEPCTCCVPTCGMGLDGVCLPVHWLPPPGGVGSGGRGCPDSRFYVSTYNMAVDSSPQNYQYAVT